MTHGNPAAAMFNFLRAAVSAMRPASATALPSIRARLDEVARATESASQRVLEQSELLGGHVGRLAEMLTHLEEHVSMEPEGRAAWSDAVQACLAMPPAVAAIARAMSTAGRPPGACARRRRRRRRRDGRSTTSCRC